jgi:hypothetical protein
MPPLSDDTGWVVEPKPAPPELAENFERADFKGFEAGRDWVSLEEKLDAAGMALLMRFGGTIGEPHA